MSPNQISSTQHPLVKHWVKIREKKKYRYECQKVLITDEKVILELSKHFSFTHLIATQPRENTILVTEAIMKKITGLDTPPTLAGEIDMPKPSKVEGKRILVLDGISDPGNMGTLLRTALAFSWDGVFIVENSCDPFNDKALRAAKGATFFLPYAFTTPQHLLTKMDEYNAYVAHPRGKPLSDLPQPLMLILGNEARGVHPEVEKSSTKIAIPMSRISESLNVAVAGGILMHVL